MKITITKQGKIVLDGDVTRVVGSHVTFGFNEDTLQLKVRRSGETAADSWLVRSNGLVIAGELLLRAMRYDVKNGAGEFAAFSNGGDSSVVITLNKEHLIFGQGE